MLGQRETNIQGKISETEENEELDVEFLATDIYYNEALFDKLAEIPVILTGTVTDPDTVILLYRLSNVGTVMGERPVLPVKYNVSDLTNALQIFGAITTWYKDTFVSRGSGHFPPNVTTELSDGTVLLINPTRDAILGAYFRGLEKVDSGVYYVVLE